MVSFRQRPLYQIGSSEGIPDRQWKGGYKKPVFGLKTDHFQTPTLVSPSGVGMVLQGCIPILTIMTETSNERVIPDHLIATIVSTGITCQILVFPGLMANPVRLFPGFGHL